MSEREEQVGSGSDADYFQRRAEAEIELAQSSTHAAAVRAHYLLAGHYLDLVHNPDLAPEPPALAPSARPIPLDERFFILGGRSSG